MLAGLDEFSNYISVLARKDKEELKAEQKKRVLKSI